MTDAVRSAEPMPERRGYLLNEYTGIREYFVLRGGVLRIRQSPKGRDTGSIYLAHGSQVTLLANHVLEVHSRVPHVHDYILAAVNEHEAEGWHDAIQASIHQEEAKMQKLQQFLETGCTIHKYNYSNSKRSRRYFWVATNGRELCWGRTKGEDTQKVNLRECIGIIYGPMTTTFQRCSHIEDPSWTCFSLLFMDRTLDLAVAGDLQVHAWFLGMQHLISRHGMCSMPMMSDADFTIRKIQYKLTDTAHSQGLVLGRYLLDRIRKQATNRGFTGIGGGTVVSSGRLSSQQASVTQQGNHSTQQPPSSSRQQQQQQQQKTSLSSEALKNGVVNPGGQLSSRVLQLQALVRERSIQVQAASAVMKKVDSLPVHQRREAAVEMLQDSALKALKKRCSSLEEDAQTLNDAGEQLGPQVKAAEKAEKSLRKLQNKVDEVESRRASLESELAQAHKSAEACTGARKSSSSAEEEAKIRCQELQLQVQDLERRLQLTQGQQHAEAEAKQNREQAEAITAADQERLSLAQKLEALNRELGKVKEAEMRSRDRFLRMQEMHRRLDQSIDPLRKAAAKLREEQRRVRAEVDELGRSFHGEIQRVAEGSEKLGQWSNSLEEKYKAAMEDRKRLHNMVLDLKGNIRVFVRVRPMNQREQQTETQGEATVSFQDDTKVGIYDGQHARRKWFDFDQVFAPGTTQVHVFEEAKPLATSVLDGYNVCVFAYGQTGSGKTHTMTGTPKDPGLNTRVLAELFRIRDERRNEYDIHLSLAITEIYNETIRDLLCPSAKKLDVKMNQDGSCSVPGLTDKDVQSVEDVLACITDASKNRAVSSTDMNDQSSRSHSIVTVRTQCMLKGSDTYVGKIHLIDLAGSENVNKSGVTGQGMREAQNINKSLSALGDVIQSLVAKNPHTPYRNSKLTMMLKDSLGGDSKTLMIVQSSPAQTNVTETLSSLNFAARARNVELGKAKRNVAG